MLRTDRHSVGRTARLLYASLYCSSWDLKTVKIQNGSNSTLEYVRHFVWHKLKVTVVHLSQGVCVGGGGGGGALIYSYIRRLGFKILNVMGDGQKNEYFWGMKILWIFLGGHHKTGMVLGVISIHFIVFLRSMYWLGVAKFSIYLGGGGGRGMSAFPDIRGGGVDAGSKPTYEKWVYYPPGHLHTRISTR